MLAAGGVELDPDAREARYGGRAAQLTSTEFAILRLLVSHAGRPVVTARIVQHAWGFTEHDSSLVKSHVSHLRKKLALPDEGPGSITGIRGLGYRLEVERTNGDGERSDG